MIPQEGVNNNRSNKQSQARSKWEGWEGGWIGRQVSSHFQHCSNSQVGDQLAFKDGFVRDSSTPSAPSLLIPPEEQREK